MADDEQPNFNLQFGHFKTITDGEKEEIYKKKRAKATNTVTKSWVNCFSEYLIEKDLPKVDDIDIDDLPDILSSFYVEQGRRSPMTPIIENQRNIKQKF